VSKAQFQLWLFHPDFPMIKELGFLWQIQAMSFKLSQLLQQDINIVL